MSQERLVIPTQEKDCRTLAQLVGDALGISNFDPFERIGRLGWEHMRLVRRDGMIAGGFGLIPMGQWFGGQSVPTGGVSLVGVAPRFRGRGIGQAMMIAALRELRQSGVPLASLYPATQTLYRRCGYEIAGGRHEIRLSLKDLPPGKHDFDVRPLEPRDAATLADLYNHRACRSSGHIDRSAFMWRRVREPRDGISGGTLLYRGERPLAYLFARQKAHDHGFDLMVTDCVCCDADGGHALLTFFGDHRSMGHEAFWFGIPGDPLLTLLPEQRFRAQLFMHWMIRITDVAGALAARGYPDGLKAQLALEVRDPQLPENQGRYELEIVDGRAIVHAPDGTIVDGGLYVAARGPELRAESARRAAIWAVNDAQTAKTMEQKALAAAERAAQPARRKKKDDEEVRPAPSQLTNAPAELRREAIAAGKRLPATRTPNDPARAAGGTMRLDIRGLAAIYSGYLSPWEAITAGLVEPPRHTADEQTLSLAASLFAGPTPWLPDMF